MTTSQATRQRVLTELLGSQGSAYSSDSILFTELVDALARKLSDTDVDKLGVVLSTRR